MRWFVDKKGEALPFLPFFDEVPSLGPLQATVGPFKVRLGNKHYLSPHFNVLVRACRRLNSSPYSLLSGMKEKTNET